MIDLLTLTSALAATFTPEALPADALQEPAQTERVFKFLALPEAWVLGLIIAPAVIWFARWSYGGLGRLERGPRIALSVLRGLAITLMLVLCFQPAWETRRYRRVTTEVHVLVDDSASMQRQDSYPDEATRGALQEVLGPGISLGEGAANPSRTDLVQRILARPDGLLSQIAENHELRLFRFSRKPQPLSDLSTLKAEGTATHIGDALDLHLSASGGSDLEAVILVSDGRSNGGLEPSDVAVKYRTADVPIHTLGVGDPSATRNAWIVGPPGPQEALVEEEVAFDVTVRAEGLAGRTTSVTLMGSLDGAPFQPLTNSTVLLPPDGEAGALRLYHAFPRQGDWTLRFELGGLPEETSSEDNTDTRFLRVNDERIRVLYIEALPRWEYRYLKNALKRMDASIEAQVWLADASAAFTQEHSEDLPPLTSLPRTPEELKEYHVVLLGDVAPEVLAPTTEGQRAWLEMLRDFVEFGGGVGFLFGEAAMPEAYRRTPIEELLPVELLSRADLQRNPPDWRREFVAAVEDAARPHDIAMLRREPAANTRLWRDGLATLRVYYPVLRARPGSQVILRHPTESNRYGNLVVAAAGEYPRGRVFWSGTDETWRWRDPYAEKYHDPFWRNVVRYLAGGRLQRRDDRFELLVDRVLVDTGDKLRVDLRVLDDGTSGALPKTWPVFVRTTDGELEPRELRQVPSEPDRYSNTFTLTEIGPVSFLVLEGNNPAGDVLGRQDVLVRIPDRELADASQDAAALRAISDATRTGDGESRGGIYLPLARADELAAEFRGGRPNTAPLETITDPIWDQAWTLFALLGLLGAEWLLRKRVRLV